MEFAITLSRDEEGRIEVACQDVPAVRAVGEYEADALVNVQRALTTALASCIREHRPIPRPRRAGRLRVAVPVLVQIKLAVYDAMRKDQVSRAELARRLGWHRPQVDRLLNLHHASKLDQVEAALSALGLRIKMTLEPSVTKNQNEAVQR